MKTGILFILLTLFVSCGDQSDRVTVIKNYDEIYLTDEQVDIEPGTDEELESIIDKMKSIAKQIYEKERTPVLVIFSYAVYLNEDGMVDAIRELPLKDDLIDQFKDDDLQIIRGEKLTDMVVEAANQWDLTPATKGGEPVKFRDDISYILEVDSEGNIKEVIPSLIQMGKSLSVLGKRLSSFKNGMAEEYRTDMDDFPMPVGGIAAIAEKVIYPENAKKAGIEGKVFVKAYINEKGDVVFAEILKGVEELNEAAVDAIVSTKFTPGKRNGKPVKSEVSIPVQFKLK